MKTKTTKAIKNSCGGQGCAIQPYVLPYCIVRKEKFTKRDI